MWINDIKYGYGILYHENGNKLFEGIWNRNNATSRTIQYLL